MEQFIVSEAYFFSCKMRVTVLLSLSFCENQGNAYKAKPSTVPDVCAQYMLGIIINLELIII